MRLSVRSALYLTVGLLGCGATSVLQPGPATAASAVACRARVPALSVSSGRAPRVSGSVLVTAGTSRVTLATSGRFRMGRAARTPSGQASLEFCLHAGRVARAVTLVKLAPGGVSLSVTPRHGLVLSRAAVHRTVAMAHNGELVDLVVQRYRSRTALLVSGARRAAVAAAIDARARIYLTAGRGRSVMAPVTVSGAPARPGTSAKGSPVPTAPATSTAGTVTSPPTAPTSAASAHPGISAAAASAIPHNPFSPTSFWNARLPSNAPIDPNSQTYVNGLVSQVHRYGAWMNTTSYSDPVYVVPPNQPTVTVTLDTWGPDLQAAWDAVPIPADAVAAQGTDENMTVWQPSTDKMWDFWQMHQVNGQWHARWGGEMDDVSTNPGYFTHSGVTGSWGASASGLALAGGLITLADLKRGSINHALALAVPLTEWKVFSWPAQRTDGWSADATALPEGIRFRLDPNLNIASLGLSPFDRELAQAAQTYGIVIRDTSYAVSFYGQDPTPTGTDPFTSLFGGTSVWSYLSQFPWSHLEALQTQLRGG